MDDVLNYCLFCLSNSEEKIMKSLRDMGCEPMSPKVKKVVPGKPQAKVKRLMPGYVFFSAEKEPDWHEVRRIPDVLRVLGYENGEYALRGTDLDFVHWLKRLNGMVEVSMAVRVGTRLSFVNGPLREMSGKILSINKHRHAVEVDFGGEGSLFSKVWCSYDYVQSNAGDGDALFPIEKGN